MVKDEINGIIITTFAANYCKIQKPINFRFKRVGMNMKTMIPKGLIVWKQSASKELTFGFSQKCVHDVVKAHTWNCTYAFKKKCNYWQ